MRLDPQEVMIELNQQKESLKSSLNTLEEDGRKYAELRQMYKKNSAMVRLGYLKNNSAAKAEALMQGDISELLGDYEYAKIMYETAKDIVKTRSTLCNVLQTEFNGLMKEWNA